jgi:hypothetical protein
MRKRDADFKALRDAPTEPVEESPEAAEVELEEPELDPDKIIGKVSRARSDERKIEILEEHGVDTSEGFETWEDLESAVEQVATKQAKQEGITQAATVGISGTPTGESTDRASLEAELERLSKEPKTRESMVERGRILERGCGRCHEKT